MSNLAPKKFDKNLSILKNVYLQFGANDPSDLQMIYMNADQFLMKESEWDYKNLTQLPNKIRSAIEVIGISAIGDPKEKKWIEQILWMWYHHATSCALSRYGDKEAAQQYSAEALSLQPADHPNRITRLLYYLTRDDIKNSEQWINTIVTEPEKTTAAYLINRYRLGDFFKIDKK